MTVDIIRATRKIGLLSARTLAAGQARIDRHVSGRMAQAAEAESLRVLHAAQADLAQRAVERWIELLYDQRDGVWWNVRADGLIKLAPPWSMSRRTSYGLSEPQARLLRRITRDITANLPEHRRLYFYATQHQRYVLNRRRFPALDAAMDWQRTTGKITPALWHGYSARYPGGR